MSCDNEYTTRMGPNLGRGNSMDKKTEARKANEQMRKRREQFFTHIRAIAEEANVPEDEADKLVEEAIQAVRASKQR